MHLRPVQTPLLMWLKTNCLVCYFSAGLFLSEAIGLQVVGKGRIPLLGSFSLLDQCKQFRKLHFKCYEVLKFEHHRPPDSFVLKAKLALFSPFAGMIS